jgi:hypothetical protein
MSAPTNKTEMDERDADINKAISAVAWNVDARGLKRHLAKRGLLIVDANEYRKARLALQLIGSDTSNELAAKVARSAIAKGT